MKLALLPAHRTKRFKHGTVASLFIAAVAVMNIGYLPVVHAGGFGGAGSGTSLDPYLITSCAEFEAINDDTTASYKMTTDLDCASEGNDIEIINDGGDFTGNLDGNGHSINVNISSDRNYVGIFDAIGGGTISNLTITGTIAGHDDTAAVGGLAGNAYDNTVTISHVTVIADVSNTLNGNTGGLIGGAYAINADHIITAGTVTSTGVNSYAVGGVFGGANCGSIIDDSHSSATVHGYNHVGGFSGEDGCEGPGSTTHNDYATGDVTADGNSAGGFIGASYSSSVNTSHATGNVHGNDGVGGFIGEGNYGTTVSQDYATGTASGHDSVGGLVGVLNNGSTIDQTYATGSASNTDNDSGGLVGYLDGGSAITNSYARGATHGECSGSLVGWLNSGTVHYSYGTGAVDASGDYHGGLVCGENDTPNDSNFYDTQTTGLSSSGLGTGETTTAMKSIATYTDTSTPGLGTTAWDFIANPHNDSGTDDLWNIVAGSNDGYPCLTWTGCVVGDSDGVSSATEDAAPNSGDANGDGTVDSDQANVASFVDTSTGKYASVAAPAGCALSGVSAAAASANATADAGYAYPAGFIAYTADCGTPGYTATVKVYAYGVPAANLVLRKYNPITHAYTTVTGASIVQTTIGGQEVAVATYQVKDGGPLDSDGLQNGTIVDPVGLAQGTLTDTGIQISAISTLATAILFASLWTTDHGQRTWARMTIPAKRSPLR